MADEEAELLDWGNEDDESQHVPHRDVVEEDAVSLGGDEDDLQAYYAYQSRTEQESSRTPAPTQKSQQTSHKRDVQRENSNGSQAVSNSVSASQSQGSQHHQPLRRHSSQPKLTHELPPKPVLAVAPAVKETSTLASSMARPDRRTNGKPHSSSDDQLPPDWEMRTPRGGGSNPYYYNTKTQESTWDRPSGGRTREKERGRSPTRENEASSRSGGDPHKSSDYAKSPITSRHYRPTSSSPNKSVDEPHSRREERPDVPPSRPRSPPPHDGHDRRDFQRPPRDVQDRPPRPRKDSVTSPERNPRRPPPRARSSERRPPEGDRTWIPRDAVPPQAVQVEREEHVIPARRKRHDSDPPRRDHPMPPREPPARRGTDYAPPPRFRSRSPPPMLQPSAAWASRESSVHDAPPLARHPSVTFVPRQGTRFDRPARSPVQDRQLRTRRDEPDAYPPMDSVPQRRGREPDFPPQHLEGEAEAKRRRTGERDADPTPTRRYMDRPPYSDLPARPMDTPPAPAPFRDEEPRLRKRAPLPPQSERFREAATQGQPPAPPPGPPGRGPPPFAPEPGPLYGPHGPRETGGGMPPRPGINNNLPSGPRSQYPPPPVRDASHPDFAQGGRLPPSGPSGGVGRSRLQNDAPMPAPFERDSTDVDMVPPDRFAPRGVPPPRGNVSAYDREPREVPQEALPKGPRAMAHRPSNADYPSVPPAPSPRPPYHPRQMPSQDTPPPRFREGKSPPPHLARIDTRNNFPVPADRPPRMEDSMSQGPRNGPSPVVADAHKEFPQDLPRGRRPPEARPPPPVDSTAKPKLSGTNSVPLAKMRAFGSPAPPSQLPAESGLRPPYGDRPEVARNPPRPRYPDDDEPRHAPYVREEYGTRSSGPIEGYGMDYGNRGEPRARDPPVDVPGRKYVPSSQPPIMGGRSLPRDFARDGPRKEAPINRRQSRFDARDRRGTMESQVAEDRVWTPRGVTPPPMQPRPGYSRETVYPPATPPPPSKEPSLVSSWHDSHEALDDYGAAVRPEERGYSDGRRSSYQGREGDRAFYSRPPSVSGLDRGRDHYGGTDGPRAARSNSVDAYPRGQNSNHYAELPPQRQQDVDLPPRPQPDRRPLYPEEPAKTRYDAPDRPTVEPRRGTRWDRPAGEPPRQGEPSVATRPDREDMESAPEKGRAADQDPELSRTSKPVRIRRPQPSSQPPATSASLSAERPPPPTNERYLGNNDREGRYLDMRGDKGNYERPNMQRRGGSLLERLSAAPATPGAATLRDRVQFEEHRDPEADSGTSGFENFGDGHEDILADPAAKRFKKRPGKSKRGRRGVP